MSTTEAKSQNETQPSPISTDKPRFQLARIEAIEARLCELDGIEKHFKAARRRFKLKAFLQWSALAAARQRRQQNGDAHGRRAN
jgi:hypothetical protein